MYFLSLFLKKLIHFGTLYVVDHKGRKHRFHGTDDASITIRFHDPAVYWRIFMNPELAAGESYMDGTLTIEDGTIFDFLHLVTKNMEWSPSNPMHNPGSDLLSRLKGWYDQTNPMNRSKENVAHHYDLSGELYELFLDEDKQYSCAYFKTDKDTLEQAQEQKKQHIANKLLLDKDQTVLDIGCGWGGLALSLNRLGAGADVTGITLSEEQLAVAQERAKDNDKVNFKLQDYRLEENTYDRIVSVGMFEHVGRKNYQTFFNKVYQCLDDDGVAMIHTIGRADGPGATDPWTRKYIFPGGYAPSLSEMTKTIERSGLYVTDLEVWRLHYAKTLHAWYDRVQANKDKIIALYDERFFRMWEYYLACSECAFLHLGHVVFQFQLTKKQDAVPFTRDYLYR